VQTSPYGLKLNGVKNFRDMMKELSSVLQMMNDGKTENKICLAEINSYRSGTYMMDISILADVTPEKVHIYHYHTEMHNSCDEMLEDSELVCEYFPMSKYQLQKLVHSGRKFNDAYESIIHHMG
jgi:hypothetical protein